MYQLIPKSLSAQFNYVSKDFLDIESLILMQEEALLDHDLRQGTIGVALPDGIEKRWLKDLSAMEKEAKDKGVTIKTELSKNIFDDQNSKVDKLLSEGISILIIAPTDSVAAASIVDKAHKANVKVVAYDRIIKNSDVDLFITFDSQRVGEIQGQYLTKTVPKGNYIILTGDPEDNNSALLLKGAMEFIQPLVTQREIKIVTNSPVLNWDPKNAYKIVADSLKANKNNINAILSPNDAIAGAAIEALKEQGLAGKVIVTGQDADVEAAKRIVQGTQAMTVFKDTRALGAAAIDAAIKLSEGKALDLSGTTNNGKIDVPSILLDSVAVTKDNLEAVLINSGFMKKEDVFTT
ncbi:sugar ABC transporter substrate-binding protein [Clostridium sp. 'White wine YQ']|uniref:sugar ABC transporter substrate-binding protein n=1 Tax=Clostridium sp. 'White wine YQ' TaxID=3027474 RepID=UPI002365A5A6|nr:substrate-binding domain-containing protein [Clostridium sp. 'White wine YQ']MDD7793627.1 sugar ABC transporter substrate-binding protein [Clostridium sp. 'White wine YQ']